MRLNRNTGAELTVGKLVAVVIAVIVGFILLPVVQDAVTSGQEWNNNSTTETTSNMLGMVTLFYVLFVVLGVVLWVVYETKGLGNK